MSFALREGVCLSVSITLKDEFLSYRDSTVAAKEEFYWDDSPFAKYKFRHLAPFIRDGIIGSNDSIVFCYLVNFVKDFHDIHFMSQKRCAEELGLSRFQVNRSMKRLCSVGLINKGYRHGSSCYYSLNKPSDAYDKYCHKTKHSINQTCADLHTHTPPTCADLHTYKKSLTPNKKLLHHQQPPAECSKFNHNNINKGEEDGEVVETKSGGINTVLLGNPPIAQPPLNNASALDAGARNAKFHTISFKIVNEGAVQMPLHSVERDGDLIVVKLLTNPAGLPAIGGGEVMPADSLCGAQGQPKGLDMYSKSKQVGVRKKETDEFKDRIDEKRKQMRQEAYARQKEKNQEYLQKRKEKGLEKVHAKRAEFNRLFDSFKAACIKHGYDAPATQSSNTSIDRMIQNYGIEDACRIAETAAKHWHHLDLVVRNYSKRPVPTLSEIAIGFVSEHLFARAVADDKGLPLAEPLGKRKEKKPSTESKQSTPKPQPPQKVEPELTAEQKLEMQKTEDDLAKKRMEKARLDEERLAAERAELQRQQEEKAAQEREQAEIRTQQMKELFAKISQERRRDYEIANADKIAAEEREIERRKKVAKEWDYETWKADMMKVINEKY